MNERIQEMSYQCWYNDSDTGKEEFDRVKFAELIVRECIEISQVGSITEEKIKRHFGVEE